MCDVRGSGAFVCGHWCVYEHVCVPTCVAVEVRMRTLDQFFEIEFSTYFDITSLRLSLYHVLERKTLLRQSYRA